MSSIKNITPIAVKPLPTSTILIFEIVFNDAVKIPIEVAIETNVTDLIPLVNACKASCISANPEDKSEEVSLKFNLSCKIPFTSSTIPDIFPTDSSILSNNPLNVLTPWKTPAPNRPANISFVEILSVIHPNSLPNPFQILSTNLLT